MSCDVSQLKRAAAKCWPSILATVGGIPRELLDGKHHPCPKCGGTDRFRLLDESSGAVICNRCFRSGNGDGIAGVMWSRNCEFTEATKLIADNLGLSNGKPTRKRVSARQRLGKLRQRNGAKQPPKPGLEFRWSWLQRVGAAKNDTAIVVPSVGADGRRRSDFTIRPASDDAKLRKGTWPKGGKAGLFVPHVDGQPRLPKAGEKWHIVEGAKDASALLRLGYNAIGLPTCRMNAAFATLFAGCHATIVPDNDQAGQDGAISTATHLDAVAASVRIAKLPGEVTEASGQDVRDVLAQPDGEQLVRRAITDAQLVGRDGQPVDEIRYRSITCAELIAGDFSVDYLIENVLVAGQPCLLAGPYKSLKTSLLVDLALSLASRGRFCGCFKVTRAVRVAVMSGESGMATLQETAQRIATRAGIDLMDVTNLLWASDLPIFGHKQHMAALEAFIVDNEIEVLLVDPAYLCMPIAADKANNLFAIGELLRSVNTICDDCGATFVIAHHTAKSKQHFDPPELSDVAWSGWAEWARQWILLNRREKYDPDGNGHHKLWLSVGGSAGHSGLWGLDVTEGRRSDPRGRTWDVEVKPASEVRAERKSESAKRREDANEERRQQDRKQVLRTLKQPGECWTQSRLKRELNWDNQRVKRAIDELTADAHIEHYESTVKGRNCDAFRLKDY